MDGLRGTGGEPPVSSVGKEEAAMDTYLRSKGLYRKKIAKDGSCLFRAVAEQVLHSQARHLEVRKSCIKYLRENRTHFEAFIEGSFDEYLKRLENPQEWVGQVEISALSLMFRKEFLIYQEPDVAPAHVTNNGFTEEIMLCFSNGNHYDIVYPSGFAESASLCQSIIYELLYENVLGVSVTKHMKTETSDWEAEEEVLDSNTSGSDGDDNTTGCEENNLSFGGINGFKSHKEEKPPQSKKSNSVLPAPVLRSLNPAVFRNVEYEVWMKSQRDQQRMDFSIAAGMQYSVGDKCKVRLEYGGAFYNAHIQEVGAENGPAVVFVEELGERKIVPLKHLKPVPLTVSNNEGWSTVAGKKIKKPYVTDPVVQFEKDNRGQKSSVRHQKTQSVPSLRLQQASGNKQHGLPADQTFQSENKGLSKTPKVPGRKLERERVEELSYKKENMHFGLTPEERRERQVIEESKSLYEMQNRDTNAFPTLSVTIVNVAASGTEVKKIPSSNREKSFRRKSEDEQRNKASKLAQSARLDKKTIEEMEKPTSTSDEAVVIPDVLVLPQQSLTAVPSQPTVVTTSGISAQVPTCAGSASDSTLLQPQVTSTFSPLPVSMPAVSQHLLPMPQTTIPSPYQDPLYPGFPVNENGERITSPPPYSYCKNGGDLPSDKSIVHFFYNLGIKAYTSPMWPPHLYLHPLHQAYLSVCRVYPNVHAYPQNSWMQEANINQNQVDPLLFMHQNEVRNDNLSSPPVMPPCSSLPLTSSVQTPVIVEQVKSHPNEIENKHQFQVRVNDPDITQATNTTMYPQPHFGQGSYMGHHSVPSHVYPQVWYGYPYQGYIENPVVQQNVYMPPQNRNMPDNNVSIDIAESNSLEGAIKPSQTQVGERRPDTPQSFNVVAAEESGLTTLLVKPGQQVILERPEMVEQKTLMQTVPENQGYPTPEQFKSNEDNSNPLTLLSASANPHEDKPMRGKEESSEDEREVSNMLSGGRSKNFYNQSYGNRRFRNEKFHQPNRGGYQSSRNEESWRGARGREDGYPHYRGYRGRQSRRRPMGDPYRQHHE